MAWLKRMVPRSFSADSPRAPTAPHAPWLAGRALVVVFSLLLAISSARLPAQGPEVASSVGGGTERVEVSVAIDAYDPSETSRIIGTFAAGTALRVGPLSASLKGYPVEYMNPRDGKVIRAFCREQDLEPFLKRAAAETPKGEPQGQVVARSPNRVLLVVSADRFNKKGAGVSQLNAAIKQAHEGDWPFKDFDVVVGKRMEDVISGGDALGASTILHARVQDRTTAVLGEVVNGVTVNPTFKYTLTVLADLYLIREGKWDKYIVGRTLRTSAGGTGNAAANDGLEYTKMVPELAKFLSGNRPKDAVRLGK